MRHWAGHVWKKCPVSNKDTQMANKLPLNSKVRSFKENSYVILIAFKIVVVFNTTSDDIKTKSADVVLKTTTILKEMRNTQLSS